MCEAVPRLLPLCVVPEFMAGAYISALNREATLAVVAKLIVSTGSNW